MEGWFFWMVITFGAKPSSNYQRKVRLKRIVAIVCFRILKESVVCSLTKGSYFQITLIEAIEIYIYVSSHDLETRIFAWKCPHEDPCVISPICSTQQLLIQIFAQVLSHGWAYRACMVRSCLFSTMLPNIQLTFFQNQVRFYAYYLTSYASKTLTAMLSFEMVHFWMKKRSIVV